MAELAKSKLDPPKRLAELAQRHWGELDGGTRVWDRPSAEVAALKHITLADLRAFFEVGLRHACPCFSGWRARARTVCLARVLVTVCWLAAVGALCILVGLHASRADAGSDQLMCGVDFRCIKGRQCCNGAQHQGSTEQHCIL